jgi:hypothetical protein
MMTTLVEETDMGLIIWGLLIGMMGMMWLLIAASLQQEHESTRNNEADPEQDPIMEQDRTPPSHPQNQRAKAAA